MSSDKIHESEPAQPVLAVPARVEPLTAMAGQFRKKPVVISAWLIDFTNKPLPEWVNDGFRSEALDWDPAGEGLWINTLVGAMVGDFGDWLIRGVKGELYACKPDVFEAAYEPAGAQPAPTAAPAEPHKSRSAVEHVVKLLTLRADDPMWANHAEVSKVLLRNAAMYLRDHPALRPAPADDDADVLATYNGRNGGRDWASVGCWLRPGERIVHDWGPAATPPARLHAPLSDEQIEAAAQELAKVMHYHWKHMPAEGRDAMRDNARRVLAAAGITAAPAAPDRTGMTYYRNHACTARGTESPDCICWTPAKKESDHE